MNAFCRAESSPFLAWPSTVRIALAVEARRRDDAGRAGVARAVGVVDDHRAAQALRGAAAELGAGHPEHLAQEVVHRQIVAHLHRAVGATVDRDAQRRHESAPFSMLASHRQRLEAVAGGVEDGVEQRGNDRDHHDLRNAFRRLVRRHRRQHLDLEIVQRQVGPARDEILSEIPLPVAGPVFVGRQRLEQGVADAHGEAALRLPEHDFRHQRLAAFKHAVGLGDAQLRRSRARSRRAPACRTCDV